MNLGRWILYTMLVLFLVVISHPVCHGAEETGMCTLTMANKTGCLTIHAAIGGLTDVRATHNFIIKPDTEASVKLPCGPIRLATRGFYGNNLVGETDGAYSLIKDATISWQMGNPNQCDVLKKQFDGRTDL